MRLIQKTDQQGVLRLVASDRLPGQPAPTLKQLVASEHDDCAGSAILVATDVAGSVSGAIRCTLRRKDNSGMIEWLHAKEDYDVIAGLIYAAYSHLGTRRMLYAGMSLAGLPGMLSPFVSGIAERRRSTTARALRAAKFTPAASTLYFLRKLGIRESAYAQYGPLDRITPVSGSGLEISLSEDDGSLLAKATLYTGDNRYWRLCHLTVRPDSRECAIASRLLKYCFKVACVRGARSIVMTVNEDDRKSVELLSDHGFDHIDTLTVHQRRP
ncbi:GNAT family N-acetyltransferase [Streptomyces sp900105245]|uniref:GNAT family N-acetyltransferase n=1 Tax=Streptomyces sp. 900105245 TaxID=3154379 RepID=A0ABV1ULG2_9ACTN